VEGGQAGEKQKKAALQKAQTALQAGQNNEVKTEKERNTEGGQKLDQCTLRDLIYSRVSSPLFPPSPPSSWPTQSSISSPLHPSSAPPSAATSSPSSAPTSPTTAAAAAAAAAAVLVGGIISCVGRKGQGRVVWSKQQHKRWGKG